MVPGLNSPLPTGSWDSLSADITFTFFFFSRFTYTHLFWLCPSCSDPWAPSPPRHWGLNLSHFCPQGTVILKTRGQHVTCQRDTVRPQILKFTLEQLDKVLSCFQSNNNNFRFVIFHFSFFSFLCSMRLVRAAYRISGPQPGTERTSLAVKVQS